VAIVTRRDGFLSLAAQRLLDAIRGGYGASRSRGIKRPARKNSARRPDA
jgi:hypothetical protein